MGMELYLQFLLQYGGMGEGLHSHSPPFFVEMVLREDSTQT